MSTHLSTHQLQRIKQYHKDVKHQVFRLEKEGNDQLAYKVRCKYDYLSNQIEQMEYD
jgi:hypothetical protein